MKTNPDTVMATVFTVLAVIVGTLTALAVYGGFPLAIFCFGLWTIALSWVALDCARRALPPAEKGDGHG